jgi:hypothetical protein
MDGVANEAPDVLDMAPLTAYCRATRSEGPGVVDMAFVAAYLDDALEERLDGALDEGTKWLRGAEPVIDALEGGGEAETGIDFSAPCEDQPRPDLGEPERDDDPDEEDSERGEAVSLASVVFSDGDALDFHGVPQHGEIGVSYHGMNMQRMTALSGSLASPLRLFVSLVPVGTPVPWLIAAVDRPPDRVPLVAGRTLVDRLEAPVRGEEGPVFLRVPALPGGWWAADGLTLPGHFCGPGGTQAFHDSISSLYVVAVVPFGLTFPIHKMQASLVAEVTHNSTHAGTWYRRSSTFGWATACNTGLQVVHRYRALKGFKWRWIRAKKYEYSADEMLPTKPRLSVFYGLVRRRRRIVYTRTTQTGGLRCFSRFARWLLD